MRLRREIRTPPRTEYLAGIVAARLGAVVVARFFPRAEREQELLAAYRAEDRRPADPDTRAARNASPSPA